MRPTDPQAKTRAPIRVPDVPAPTARLCWVQKLDAPNAMTRCDRRQGHEGPHSWEVLAAYDALVLEQESAKTVYANVEAWLSEHAVKVETHDWAHTKQALAYGFRAYAKYLRELAAGRPPFIKRLDECRLAEAKVKALSAALRATVAALEQVEWRVGLCCWCGAEDVRGHADDCQRQAALAHAARVLAGEGE